MYTGPCVSRASSSVYICARGPAASIYNSQEYSARTGGATLRATLPLKAELASKVATAMHRGTR